ncbi:MAG TPA: hypothetical protein VKO83_09635 [Steroidobacteraceae bacterium]|nr:hypothetical protein [Steroidobacteraceae bacterium]
MNAHAFSAAERDAVYRAIRERRDSEGWDRRRAVADCMFENGWGES